MKRTTPARMRELAVSERAELDRLLDQVMIAHVGLSTGHGEAGHGDGGRGDVAVFPTALARDAGAAEPDAFVTTALAFLRPGRHDEVSRYTMARADHLGGGTTPWSQRPFPAGKCSLRPRVVATVYLGIAGESGLPNPRRGLARV